MTLKEFYKKYDNSIERAISGALKEDRVFEDVTTGLLFPGNSGTKKVKAKLLCKDDCVLAGIEIFRRVYGQVDAAIRFRKFYSDGKHLHRSSIAAEIYGPVSSLLRGERTALNFLQRMSGIASTTSNFVKNLKNARAKILPTRKTTPNFRIFELIAVKLGGGDFHRFSLASSVMVKDNHISAAGSLDAVLRSIDSSVLSKGIQRNFEVEVKNLKELRILLKRSSKTVKIVMLDNFKPEMVTEAARLLKGTGIKIEVSGGITPGNFEKYQHPDIDFYSIGMLTHSYESIDFSLEIGG